MHWVFIPCHIMNICENVCHQALKQAAWWPAFLKAFWSTQEALVIVQQPSKVIEQLLVARGQHEGRRRERGRGTRGGRSGFQGASSELPACSICIIIELLFRILISARYWFFSPPQRLNQLELTITHFAFSPHPCHLLSSSFFSVPRSQFYTLLLIGQNLLLCEFNAS